MYFDKWSGIRRMPLHLHADISSYVAEDTNDNLYKYSRRSCRRVSSIDISLEQSSLLCWFAALY